MPVYLPFVISYNYALTTNGVNNKQKLRVIHCQATCCKALTNQASHLITCALYEL